MAARPALGLARVRRRDSNPAEASTLAAPQVNPPRVLLHGHRLAFPNRPVTCVKRTMRQVTTGLVLPYEHERAAAPIAALTVHVPLALGIVLAGFFECVPLGAVDSGARAALVTVEYLCAP